MLALQNTAEVKLELDGLSCGFEGVATSSAKFDLSVSLGEERGADGAPAGIGGVVEYATDLFDRASVEALIRPARSPAGGCGCRPRPCDREPGHPRARRARHHPAGLERHRACDPRPPPCRSCSPRRWPARPMRSRWCTRTRASATASSTGVPTSWRITCARSASVPRWWWGCASERSPAMLVGLIGILKAGGAYLPLDPGYPAERLAFMLEDAGAPVLVTQSALVDRLPAHGAHVVRLDADAPAIAAQPTSAPALDARPAQPRLCHLHLGLHRHAERRGGSLMMICADRMRRTDCVELIAHDAICCQMTSLGVRRLDLRDSGVRCSTAPALVVVPG